MRTLYFDLSMGATKDMLMSVLLELTDCKQDFLDRMNSVGIDGISVAHSRSSSRGVEGSRVAIKLSGHEELGHMSLNDVTRLIWRLNLPEEVRLDAIGVYRIIGRAEAKAHEVPIGDVHFHEVGSRLSILNAAGCCLLMNMLKPERVLASPVHVGSGTVKCAHGILPVPAPATANILEGVPSYSGDILGELVTPTSAAILRYYVQDFCEMPRLSGIKTGVGIGEREYSLPHCVRAYLGTSD